MIEQKGIGFAAAVVALLGSGMVGCGEKSEEDGLTLVKCAGINECAGQSECASASGGNSCEGQNECAGQGWITVTRDECSAEGGTELEEA